MVKKGVKAGEKMEQNRCKIECIKGAKEWQNKVQNTAKKVFVQERDKMCAQSTLFRVAQYQAE